MPRLARIVVPGVPHHVTQRGNRRQTTFFGPEDYRLYQLLLGEFASRAGLEIWAWCLMPTHVHLVVMPARVDSLARGLGEAHRRYSLGINRREGWRGYLWQGRFASCALDDDFLLAAVRHVELNPVRAQLAARPQDWPWSSARAHLEGLADGLTGSSPLPDMLPDWAGFLAAGLDETQAERLRAGERTGRPVGSTAFVAELARRTGRPLLPQKRGPKPRAPAPEATAN